MKSRLLWKVLAANAGVFLLAYLIVWWSIDTLAADYFMALMKEYDIDPTKVNEMFLSATHRALVWATAGSLVLAVVLNYLLVRRALRPLSEMAKVTARIAAGDYSARVVTRADDEIGHLGEAFNEMATSLERIETLRKTMVIGVAHELRTPLTNLRGYLEALRDRVIEPSEATIQTLEQETNRLIALAEDVLQLAKSGSFSATIQSRHLNLAHVVRETSRALAPRFRARGQRVRADLRAADRTIPGDPKKMRLVVKNLLENALAYSPPGSQVQLGSSVENGSVRLEVQNPGEGIAPSDLPYIFEGFYRGEKSRSRAHGGAGIGLAVVKELVRLHGGTVGADSSPGRTRIWFTLPLR